MKLELRIWEGGNSSVIVDTGNQPYSEVKIACADLAEALKKRVSVNIGDYLVFEQDGREEKKAARATHSGR